jgi:predicted DNA-binding ribbon-helix-helix protein
MSTLVSRNVTLQGRRTSLRMERAMWDALEEICRRENQSMHDLCAHVDRTRAERTLTAGIRVFIVEYYRRAATEHGHASAGHGRLDRDR